jgi:hypothetical protein
MEEVEEALTDIVAGHKGGPLNKLSAISHRRTRSANTRLTSDSAVCHHGRFLMKLTMFGLLACATLLGQQDVPRYTIFGGGSFFRVHASGAEDGEVVGVPSSELQQRNLNFNLYGWNGQATEHLNQWFGTDLDFAGNYGSPGAPFLCSDVSASAAASCLLTGKPLEAVQTRLYTTTMGPRFTVPHLGRLKPYAHILVGYGHISGSINQSAIFTPIPTVLPSGYSKSDGALAVAPGAGIDLALSPRFGVRLFELDYVMTRFYGQRQDNVRVSAGLILQLGSR